ncbi:MAG TPA: hypothetical protein VFB12_29810 [Ktedonobacteraceae bacterium]|nr:hypothetical protein [Ktedonobacteraceae bacterium]
MSQEYNSTSKKRRARHNRNRPMLVTTEQNEQLAPTTDDLGEDTGPLAGSISETVETSEATEVPVAESKGSRTASAIRRLPSFFSSVGKREQEEAPKKDVDVVQARLARATRGKAATSTSKASKDTDQEETKTETKATAPAPSRTSAARPSTPPSPFKMRYVLGMVIYLFGAQFLLPAEKLLMESIHAEVLLTSFPLFGSRADIYTSFILNIATLIGLLWLLVKFDYLPSSLGKMSGAAQSGTGSRASQNTGDGPRRTPPPTIKPGVPGESDDLYRSYRSNQRREKKR